MLEIVGTGAVGVVLKGFEPRLQRFVAIKVLAPQLTGSAAARKRFAREARAAAAISHENVVMIHAVEEGTHPYLVMEYVPGQSLQARLDSSGPLPVADIVTIARQVASGLAAAHARGLVHRDVKPANILLETPGTRAKLTDFGLAQEDGDGSRSQSAVLAGTPLYMAPEQARGAAVDQRTDLFSLGSVLYAMCTGRPPFRAGNPLAVLRKICEEQPEPIRQLNPAIPAWLAALVERLLAKAPEQRLQSAREVVEVLQRQQAPAVPAPRKRRVLPWLVPACLLAALVALAALGWSEATGRTQLTGQAGRLAGEAVQRARGEGTLVIESDDPELTFTLAGSDISLEGGGSHELHLRHGSYIVRASRGGQPVHEEEVTVPRGGREVVRPSVPPPVTPPPFVVLAHRHRPRREAKTLAEALERARPGDTIEVRGDGPFVTPPLSVRGKPLVIRAAAGSQPVIRMEVPARKGTFNLLHSNASLVLEGLELQARGPANPLPDQQICLVDVSGANVHLAHCRCVIEGPFGLVERCVNFSGALVEMRSCEFLRPWSHHYPTLVWHSQNRSRLVLENSIVAGAHACVWVFSGGTDLRDVSVQVRNSTLLGRDSSLSFWLNAMPQGQPAFVVEARGNVFDVRTTRENRFLWFAQNPSGDEPLTAARGEALLSRLAALREDDNVYPADVNLLHLTNTQHKLLTGARPRRTLESWLEFWKAPRSRSVQGHAVFAGDDLVARLDKAPTEVGPADFRLAAGSPGKGAGTKGRDLGANVDEVGPGPPYERWKKTAAYQEWRWHTGQVPAEGASAKRR